MIPFSAMSHTPHPPAHLTPPASAMLRAEGAKEVSLFGSEARGQAGPDSDLDFAVSGLPPRLFFRAVAGALRLAQRQIDLVDLDHDSPFTRHLRSSGVLRRVG